MAVDELPVVGALRKLSIFGADQAGAYREHFGAICDVLGPEVRTKLQSQTRAWASGSEPGLRILTGNAGTGKTTATEAYCDELGEVLPREDALFEVKEGRWVVKDLSGLPDLNTRQEALTKSLELAQSGAQVLMCANEGILRDTIEALPSGTVAITELLDDALESGAARSDGVLIVNINRQRPTAPEIWDAILDYMTQEVLWADGCEGCPIDGAGCPMRQNAAALRRQDVREALRMLVRIGTGEAVPTIREMFAILAWAIVGGASCHDVKEKARDQGGAAFTAEDSYFARALGHGLSLEAIERSPLLAGMRGSGAGEVSDLEVDEWLRDTAGAPGPIRALAGTPNDEMDDETDPLAGSRSLHDRVRTEVGTMTFHSLGETIATSEDLERVDAGLNALVGGDSPRQGLWRRRVFFEGTGALGGPVAACARLLLMGYSADLLDLADRLAEGADTVLDVSQIVHGLNFLVCGFSSANEGLIVPEQACLFARDPGAFRPARPSLVHAQVPLNKVTLTAPDRGMVRELIDVDPIEVDLSVVAETELSLRIRPRLYEAIRLAAEFEGPVGQGIAEMTDLRGFYGRLAAATPADETLRVADPSAHPPALVAIRLPHFADA